MKAKNNYYQTKKRRWYRTIVLLFLLCLYGHTQAQNVTISPKTGKLMAALTEDHEVGFQNGWSSLWRHDQLPLSLTVADYPDLTPSGELKRPAGNIAIENNELVLLGGMTRNLYMEVSLPKGYRITGYTLVMKNNLNGKTVRGMKLGEVTKKMYETNKDFDLGSAKTTSEQIGKYNEETKEYTIKRTSMTKDDMGNQLYFCLDKGNANAYFGVTIKHFELHFTAEGDFTEHVAPVLVSDIQSPVSYYEMPFTTSKLDIGPIKPNSKNGSKTYYSYNYKNVADLTANMIIYQQAAVNAQKEAADVAASKHISAFVMDNKTHFGLGNDTYFVETPTTATTTHGDNLLLGYRIVGAKFNCAYAKDRKYSEFKIHYKKFWGSTYYLTETGGTSTNAAQAAKWFIDDTGYMRIGNTYLQVDNSGAISVTPNKKMASVIRRDGDNIICGNKYLRLGSGKKLEFGSQNSAASAEETGTNITISKGAPYTLKIYDKTGKNVVQKIDIKNANDAGSYKLTDLNNDAVKFEVSGLTGTDKQAVVSVDVTMQALNPFIHSIDIVCHDWADAHPMTQTFTANDFSVRGGKFTFYVPEDFSVKEGQQQPCKFTFENLYSLYGDKTYYAGTEKQKDGNARYVFIQSPYDQNFKGLYDAAYDPNADYKQKIKALVSGTKAFRFNNADELGNNSTSPDIKYFNEFPFSKKAYSGEFKELSLMKDGSEVRYLFTADETRYNISPATATEHRSHAFYVMDIQLVLKQYKPKFTWVPIYTSTCYEENGKDVEKPQYGLKLGTTEMGESGKMGYLTVDQINKILLNDNEILGSGSTPRPAEIKSPEQVLYVDASDLMTVVYRKATIEGGKDDLDQAMSLLGKNALFYLPENLAPAKNNFATKTGTGEFRACKDIVITDKKPFYAPYNIRVDAAQTATYTREITVPKNGKATFASVMLPFTLSINNDGVHTNEDGSCKFRLSKMNENSCITLSQNEASKPNNYKAKAKFIPLTGTSTKANTPYMVEVLSAPTSDKISFIATQKGSDVVASTSMANDTYLFKGEAAKGKIGQYDVNFTNYGSYSGKKLNKNRKIFYFSGNMYLCSKNLDAEFPWLYVYPFRAFYEYTGGADAKDLSGMSVIYDDSQDEATGIANLQPRPNLAVQAGNGTITFAATVDSKVNIYTVTGTLASSVNVKAGSTETINVPAGMYVINGVKVIVK
ncbi:hypothetical protein [Prevotella nigrescens]|uniref:hypothetical protein n=1 Tax=Prevotella nigrescens TaxID=28133 RepID=UPI0002AECA21|nr:hypothetical protein [Prevotella nigrescens]ELX67222.1 hypothetical protein HMPREF0662_01483 [Prevotella nigrescens F0103]QUB54233.1 hypothetical protein J4865_02265 [Prevotella nigrescens F0103]